MEKPSETNKRLGEIAQWQRDHGEEDRNVHKAIDARFDNMDSNISLLPDEAKIEEIVRKVLIEVLYSAGRGTKAFVLTGAAIIVALGVITGGFKAILAWLGFGLISK